jgi:hypothetical protein
VSKEVAAARRKQRKNGRTPAVGRLSSRYSQSMAQSAVGKARKEAGGDNDSQNCSPEIHP